MLSTSTNEEAKNNIYIYRCQCVCVHTHACMPVGAYLYSFHVGVKSLIL